MAVKAERKISPEARSACAALVALVILLVPAASALSAHHAAALEERSLTAPREQAATAGYGSLGCLVGFADSALCFSLGGAVYWLWTLICGGIPGGLCTVGDACLVAFTLIFWAIGMFFYILALICSVLEILTLITIIGWIIFGLLAVLFVVIALVCGIFPLIPWLPATSCNCAIPAWYHSCAFCGKVIGFCTNLIAGAWANFLEGYFVSEILSILLGLPYCGVGAIATGCIGLVASYIPAILQAVTPMIPDCISWLSVLVQDCIGFIGCCGCGVGGGGIVALVCSAACACCSGCLGAVTGLLNPITCLFMLTPLAVTVIVPALAGIVIGFLAGAVLGCCYCGYPWVACSFCAEILSAVIEAAYVLCSAFSIHLPTHVLCAPVSGCPLELSFGCCCGVPIDLCSWTFLNVQDQILWLWQRFFQSFSD